MALGEIINVGAGCITLFMAVWPLSKRPGLYWLFFIFATNFIAYLILDADDFRRPLTGMNTIIHLTSFVIVRFATIPIRVKRKLAIMRSGADFQSE